MKLYRFQTDSSTAAASHKRISQWYVMRCCGRIPCCQESQWNPLGLTVQHKTDRQAICSKLLERFKTKGETFLTQTVKADATWVHHFELETKGQFMEWHHLQFPQKKKFKESVRRQGNDHCFLGLWRSNSCGCNAEKGDNQLWHLYQDTHRTQEAFQMSLASQESKRNLASAWQCQITTSLKTMEAITKFGWTVLPHPSYSPDLAAPNFHLFRDLKNVVCDTKFETNDDVIHIVRTWLHEQDKDWYWQGIHKRTCSLSAIKWPQNLWIESNHYSSHCVIFMI